MRSSAPHSRLLLVLLFGAGLSHAAGGPVPLTAGTYVLASYTPCAEAPLAGVMGFDATQGFFGPHESHCRTAVLRHQGSSYRVKRTCSAAGDGSPLKPSSVLMNVRVESATAFVVTRGKDDDDYALCPGFH